MSEPANINITLTIGGRNHVIATAPSEQAHLRMLAAMIDDRVRKLGMASNQSETRMLLIGALVLADELHALQNATAAQVSPAPASPAPDPGVHARIAALADRVEKLALRLEQSDAAP